MKPEELRIGNLLKWEDESNDIVIVTGIYKKDSKYYISYNEIDKNNPSGNALLSEFLAIPITEELLLKAGFEKGYCKGIFYFKEDFFIYLLNNKFFYCTNQWDGGTNEDLLEICELKYIHRLQNLYYELYDKTLIFNL